MKNASTTLLLLFCFLITGCKNDISTICLIDRAEVLLKTNPDSARLLLDSISFPDNLPDKELARWCMLSGQVADTLYTGLPYSIQLERAQRYYLSHGTPSEQAQIILYLGRAYVDDKEHDKAMQIYLSALDIALNAKDYNRAGYICSYMGDLYDFEGSYLLGKDKYEQAANYFLKADNRRSYVFALRDVGRMYVHVDSCEQALTYFHEAYRIITEVGDSSDISYISNGLGNTYQVLGNYELAKQYFQETLVLSDFDNAPTYLALANIYISQHQYDSARIYLQLANLPTFNPFTPRDILYQYYALEEAAGNPTKALEYVDQYLSVADSIRTIQNTMNIVGAEKRYNHLKIMFENSELRRDNQWFFILFLISFSACLFVFTTYQIRISRKNKRIYFQHIEIERKGNVLLRQQADLRSQQEELRAMQLQLQENQQAQQKTELLKKEYAAKELEIEEQKKRIIVQQKDLLLSSAIAKRLIKLSSNVVAQANKSPLTDKDWEKIYSTVNCNSSDLI